MSQEELGKYAVLVGYMSDQDPIYIYVGGELRGVAHKTGSETASPYALEFVLGNIRMECPKVDSIEAAIDLILDTVKRKEQAES